MNRPDAAALCGKLSMQEGVNYHLPTEAQWEYACRAGTTTAYSFRIETSKLAKHAWYKKNARDVGERYAHGVGQKLPNPWGLFDMHGNVWEWCQDWSGEYGSEKVLIDPSGPASGKSRVLRGGSFSSVADYCRSAYRYVRTRSPLLQLWFSRVEDFQLLRRTSLLNATGRFNQGFSLDGEILPTCTLVPRGKLLDPKTGGRVNG